MGFRGVFSDGKTSILLFDPSQELANCAAHGIPPPAALSKANSLAVPQGPEPARGWILVRRGDLDNLNLNARCSLTMTVVDEAKGINDTRIWQNLIIAREPQVVIPSFTANDEDGVCLVELTDVRHLLKNPTFGAAINSSYNVRSLAVGATWDTSTLNVGVPWTWAGMVADLWGNVSATLGAAPALPFSPDGTPEGWIFRGATAWESLTAVLWRIGCAVRADLTLSAGKQFTIVQIGAADKVASATLAAAEQQDRLIHDAEFQTVDMGTVPRGVRVFFHKQSNANQSIIASHQWQTTPLYSVDVTGPDAFTENVYAPILDDMAAIYDSTGTLTNAAALATRAAERSADFFRMIADDRRWQRFSGLVGLAAGSNLKGVRWMQIGQGCMTEVIWHPYLGLALDDDAVWQTVYADPKRQGFYNGWPAASASTYLAVTTSPITARVGTQFGQGTAELQKIPGGLLTDAGTATEIYNKFAHVIPTGVTVSLLRDSSSGLLWVVEPDRKQYSDCVNGFLSKLVSDDGGINYSITSLCIPCPACGSGSGCGCPCVSLTTLCLTFADGRSVTLTGPALTPPCASSQEWSGSGTGTLTGGTFKFWCNGPFGPGYILSVNTIGGVDYFLSTTNTWDCSSPQSLVGDSRSDTTGLGLSSTATITVGACSGSGSGSGTGSGGGCSITRTQLLATSQTGSGFSATVPGTVPAGALLVVKVGVGGNGSPISVTFNGVGMNQDLHQDLPSIDGSMSQWSLPISAPVTNGTLTSSSQANGPFLYLFTSTQIVGLVSNLVDSPTKKTDSGISSSPDAGFSANTATVCEISEATFVLKTPSGAPAWQNGFSSGGLVSGTSGGSTYELLDGYRILSAIVAVDAANSLTAAEWQGGEACYK
jgi:hypothetical protein